MSKLLENKQMLHIAAEVVVLLGVSFYFNSKCKKLMGHIENLAQHIEEQDSTIQKHEQMIQSLGASLTELRQTLPQMLQQSKAAAVTPQRIIQQKAQPKPAQPKPVTQRRLRAKKQPILDVIKEEPEEIVEYPTSRVEDYDSSESEESDLAAELGDELLDLDDTDFGDLKKQ